MKETIIKRNSNKIPIADEMRIKMLYMAEKPFSMIESITGYSKPRIAGVVANRGWVEERRKHRAQLALSTEMEIKLLQERKTRWVKNKINELEDFNKSAVDIVKATANEKDPSKFGSAITALDKIDKMFRRNTGMDKVKGGQDNPLQINLLISNNFDPEQNRVSGDKAINVSAEEVT